MNQKGFVNIVLVISVVILMGVVGYISLRNTVVYDEKSEPNDSQSAAPAQMPVAPGTIGVKVYFWNQNAMSCVETAAFIREIPGTEKVATAALEELFKGPNETEKAKGYLTMLPNGSRLNSLVIKEGIAYADFNVITQSGGGSTSMCVRVEQIKQTLLQFPTIDSVKFSINGEDDQGIIFQP